MTLKNLFWWKYKPADEREQALFTQAYERTAKVLAEGLLLLGLFLVWKPDARMLNNYAWLEYAFDPRVIGCALFALVLTAYLVGGHTLRNESLKLQMPATSKVTYVLALLAAVVLLAVVCQTFILN
jgi:hypothetical protein